MSLSRGERNLDALFAIQAGTDQFDSLPRPVLIAFLVGSDTTSGVLSLLLYHLLSHRDVYDRLVSELSAKYPSPLHLDDNVCDLPYLNAVVNEGIRLGTPFPGLPRVVPKGGAVLAGRFVPENVIVAVPAYAQQVSAENFSPSPKEFRPQRWLPDGLGLDTVLRTSALMAFSFGMCTSRVLLTILS